MSQTKVDKILNWFKNNKTISVIIVLALISIGLNKFIGSAIENVTFFRSFLNKCVLNRQKVINKVQETGKNEIEIKSDKYGVVFEKPITIKNYIVDKMGDQSPAVVSGGNVTISYGVSQETYNTLIETLKGNQKTIDHLLKKLDEKDIDIKDRDAEIQKWIEKYKELVSRLALRSTEDILAAQTKGKLDAGDIEGAEKLLQQSLERKKQHIDEMKKAAASDSYELGLIKELQLDYQGARNYFKQALEYDSENSEYLNKYGMTLNTLGNSKEAIEHYTKALDKDLKVYGEMHPTVAGVYNNLGLAWQNLGDAKKAIEYYTKALDINLKVYGEIHPHVATRYNNLGSAWQNLGDAKKAIEYCTKALDIDLKVYG
jgi:tetratricopeptide (TPR) repeat protein